MPYHKLEAMEFQIEEEKVEMAVKMELMVDCPLLGVPEII
jgi:hypothetical protein